jgi:hypothetical protein
MSGVGLLEGYGHGDIKRGVSRARHSHAIEAKNCVEKVASEDVLNYASLLTTQLLWLCSLGKLVMLLNKHVKQVD